MNKTIYVLPHEEPVPFQYTRRQIADGIGVLAALAVGLTTVCTLLMGTWGW